MTSPEAFYKSKLKEHEQEYRFLKNRLTIVSLLRLASFVLLITAGYLYFRNGQTSWLIALILLLIGFVVFIRISFSLSSRKKLTEQLVLINKNELGVLQQLDNTFPDGADIAARSIYADDLDIFGRRSVFHLLNRTTTSHGAAALANLLNKPHQQHNNIMLLQDAIRNLSGQTDKRQLIMAHGLLQTEEKEDINNITKWLETDNRLAGKSWLSAIRIALPLINILAFLYYLSADNPLLLLCGIAISWMLTGYYAKYVLAQHTLIGKKQVILDQYASILKHFYGVTPGDSAVLQELKNTAHEAHNEIYKLSKLSGLFDQRFNLLVNIILNSFFLYDIQCMIALEKWKQRNKSYVSKWLETVGRIEKINSFAGFAFNNPAYVFPVVRDGEPVIHTNNLGHPLIAPSTQVANDIILGEQEKILLITGSNMSGKSTFLRTVGINLLLAQCGMPVCAEKFEFAPLNILSSIRINDSLQENTSYFMAELKRLREIINALETGKPALVLIDEVLRGTNSDDKTHGSAAFIERLMAYKCLVLFATHDLSLSEMENTHPGAIGNYCFESLIQNGELSFDYKLHKGVATNKNASFLMQKMGIV